MSAWRRARGVMKPKKNSPESQQSDRKKKRLIGLLILVTGMLVMLGLCFISIIPEKYDLRVGSIATKTITASKDVVDTVTTEKRRQAAADAVLPSYHLIDGVEETVLNKLNLLLDQMKTVVTYSDLLMSERGVSAKEELAFSDADLAYAQTLLPDLTLAKYQLTTLLRSTSDEIDNERDVFSAVLHNTMAATVSQGQEEQAISSILNIIGYRINTDMLQNVSRPLLRACVSPNMVIDQDATSAARQLAYDSVENVMYKQGENIVESGTRVTAAQLELLRSLGLLKGNLVDNNAYAGAALLYVILGVMLYLLLRLFDDVMLTDFRKMSMLMLTLIITQGLCIAALKLNVPFLAPTLFAVILLTATTSASVAITANTVMALLMAGLSMGGDNAYTSEMVYLVYMVLVGGPICALILCKRSQRTRVLVCGLLTGISNAAVLVAASMLTRNNVQDTQQAALWAMGGGIVSGLLAVSCQPVFEVVLNLATTTKLLELANPNQPLLRRLLIETPGTYHHSIVVGNLAEAAAERVGANPLLARVGAYYHDIGKLKRPQYFKENQIGENPHAKTDPYVSAAIVTSHTRDGVQMAQKAHLPYEVQQIIAQHHGDTPVMYFYYKAVKEFPDAQVNIKDFRYDGQKPQTKEAAIVMLADTIEAAVRSMQNPTPESIEDFIVQLVRSKLEDGQLSMSPLTFAEMDKICEAFAAVMNGVFHERIEYPAMSIQQIREKNEEKVALSHKDTDESGVQTQAALMKRKQSAQPSPVAFVKPNDQPVAEQTRAQKTKPAAPIAAQTDADKQEMQKPAAPAAPVAKQPSTKPVERPIDAPKPEHAVMQKTESKPEPAATPKPEPKPEMKAEGQDEPNPARIPATEAVEQERSATPAQDARQVNEMAVNPAEQADHTVACEHQNDSAHDVTKDTPHEA